MSKEDDYRKNAAETIELASRAVSTTDKGHLLALAEKWLDLADRAHRLTKRFGAIPRHHPPIDAKLGERTDADQRHCEAPDLVTGRAVQTVIPITARDPLSPQGTWRRL